MRTDRAQKARDELAAIRFQADALAEDPTGRDWYAAKVADLLVRTIDILDRVLQSMGSSR